ncbi:MAG: hypothetical protein JWM91_2533, partial [Rhodospirillales bacterium]|nr:hypothetical protein [Rhodospirillales bacterium]
MEKWTVITIYIVDFSSKRAPASQSGLRLKRSIQRQRTTLDGGFAAIRKYELKLHV